MTISDEVRGTGDRHDPDEVHLVARGIATAVAPVTGLTTLQAELLEAIASALTGVDLDYRQLEPLGVDEFAAALAARDLTYRQRIVHHMVLAELVLKPLPHEVARRVATYADALGVTDDFVRVARRYAQGAYGLAWVDLRRNGFVSHVTEAGAGEVAPGRRAPGDAFAPAEVDPELAARWRDYAALPDDSLGRAVWELYDTRGFILPGDPGGASAYLAQHDYVHVLADYGTNLRGELEVFALIGRANPDPKGFAWLATLIGLFETGYVSNTGFFVRDIRDRNVQAMGMHRRLADAIRRGKQICDALDADLFGLDYHALAGVPVDEARQHFQFPAKSERALAAGSAGAFEPDGMSEIQRQTYAQRRGGPTA